MSLLIQTSTTLNKEYTAMPIYHAIMKHLYMYTNTTSQLLRTQSHIHSPINTTVANEIRDQTTICWHPFFKGRLRKHCSTSQTHYYSQRNNLDIFTYTTLCWKSRLIRTIIGGCIACCQKHNTTLHGCTAPENAHLRIHTLKSEWPRPISMFTTLSF